MRVAIVGSGSDRPRLGRRVRARRVRRCAVRCRAPAIAEAARGFVADGLRTRRMASAGCAAACASLAIELADALAGAELVQENLPERVEVKRAIFAELDPLAAPDAILASSTSTIVASPFTENLAGPPPLPGRPSGQPAASRAGGRARRRAVDRARRHCARQGDLPAGRAGADRGAARDRRLHSQPPAGGAAVGGLPPGRRGLRVAAGPGQDARATGSACAGRSWGRSRRSSSTRRAAFRTTAPATARASAG